MNENNKSDINPKLEALLKEELTNRAKKLETMEKWKREGSVKRKNFVLPAAISSIAAILVVGFFIFFRNGVTEPSMGTDTSVAPAGTAVFRGNLIAPTIYEALEAGNKTKAIQMIDSCQNECSAELTKLGTMEVETEQKQELEDRKLMLNQELQELESLRNSIK